MPSSNPLPPKENSLFKRILKCYERKQYKYGLKFAKLILSNPKYADHGETLAMKGLTLNCLGRKEEAYEHVRLGLRNDLKSHVCWHVYGLLQRSDKKYDEAIKCYRNALKWDKDNLQILRDLSLLQVQMRDLEGFRETRYQLFLLRPSQRNSWIGFAMAYHLLKDYEMALNILESYRKTQEALLEEAAMQKIPPKTDEDGIQQSTPNYQALFEHSELLLYQCMVMEESGAIQDAVRHLDSYKDKIFDKVTIHESYGSLYLKLGMYDLAFKHYNLLLERNPENTEYYLKLQEAQRLDCDDDKYQMSLCLQMKFPKSLAPKRLALRYVTGDKFRIEVDKYMRRGFTKGVPPLFVDLKSLYTNAEKVAIIQELCHDFVHALITKRKFSIDDREEVPISALLWVYYYMAQHYDYLKDTATALLYIDRAIEHTPTLIELFVAKGQIYKHAGDVYEAYKWMDEAQSLDTADRYINSKCAKYMLRANMINEAEEMCSKFTREGVSAMSNLNEMQCIWFETECALAYQRMGQWGEALKKCHEIDRHFSEITDDQFDFHTYCMRKMTLRSYVGLLRLEDVLRSHNFYFRAAKCAIQVYLRLYDKPLTTESNEQQLNTEKIEPSELKKLKSKQRKARHKAAMEKAKLAAAQAQQQKNKTAVTDELGETHQFEELVAEKLERADNVLDQAIKFLKPLQALSTENIETHLMAFEIYYRKSKPLLMLQSIKRAHRLDSENGELHSCLIRFKLALVNMRDSLEPTVLEVIEREMEPILPWGVTPKQVNERFLLKIDNVEKLLEGARMMYLLDPNEQDEAISLITSVIDAECCDGINLEMCTKIYRLLREGEFGLGVEKRCEEFKAKCSILYPHATVFKSAVENSKTKSAKSGQLDIPGSCNYRQCLEEDACCGSGGCDSGGNKGGKNDIFSDHLRLSNKDEISLPVTFVTMED